jgi:hypothetical protein
VCRYQDCEQLLRAEILHTPQTRVANGKHEEKNGAMEGAGGVLGTTGWWDGYVKVNKTSDGTEVATMVGHSKPVYCLAVDRNHVASGTTSVASVQYTRTRTRKHHSRLRLTWRRGPVRPRIIGQDGQAVGLQANHRIGPHHRQPQPLRSAVPRPHAVLILPHPLPNILFSSARAPIHSNAETTCVELCSACRCT